MSSSSFLLETSSWQGTKFHRYVFIRSTDGLFLLVIHKRARRIFFK